MLQFECPYCKAKCESAAEFAGKSIACPGCGKAVPVPAQSSATKGGAALIRNVLLVVAGLGLVAFIVIWGQPVGKPPPHTGPNPVVVMDTSMGSITIELLPDKAPITVDNFLKYVDAKFYDDTTFHRVIEDFMIQGGGVDAATKKEKKESFAPIQNESGNGLSNTRGTVAMARTNDPDSARAQFFINVAPNQRLDGMLGNVGYTVFGRVIGDGMNVVDQIRAVRTVNDVPVVDVVIKSIRRVETK
jgi:peptidyl-prolyl cis-trans isomerase A (cyclophilin A)